MFNNRFKSNYIYYYNIIKREYLHDCIHISTFERHLHNEIIWKQKHWLIFRKTFCPQ